MKLLFILLGIIILPLAHAEITTNVGIYRQQTQDTYDGKILNLLISDKEWRLGGSFLNGEYDGNIKAENSTLLLGLTKVYGPFYANLDSEVSKSSDRKPFSSHTLQGNYSIKSYEFGLGYRYADFKAEDVQIGIVSARYFLNDFSYLGLGTYLSPNKNDLKSYVLNTRFKPFEKVETYLFYAWGRTKEDIGIEQDFNSVSGKITWVDKHFSYSLETYNSWGDLIDDNIWGISISWAL